MLGRKKREEQTAEKLLGREIKDFPEGPEGQTELSKEEVEKLRQAVLQEREQAKAKPAVKIPTPSKTPKTKTGAIKTEDVEAVENILEEGMGDMYQSLPPSLKPKFKQKGEATAIAIADLLNQTKVKVKKIIALIKNWLKMIPGINKYFLEQEAKIKADRIIELRRK